MSYLEDYEKRLLFSALHREKKICEKIDKECTGKIKLKPIVESLERKFYYDKIEKEIRNKAIDEFVNSLKNSSNMHKWSCRDMTLEFCNGDDCDECENEFMKEIYEIAEQMKGE